MIKIIDNFLDDEEFIKIESIFFKQSENRPYLSEELDEKDFPWYFRNSTSYSPRQEENIDTITNYQFVHTFYASHQCLSSYYDDLTIIFDKLGMKSLLRCKANMQMRTEKIVERQLHQDRPNGCDPNKDPYTIAVYYLNTNDGYTKFEDGRKVESIANRMAIFSPKLKHASTTCTNQKRRLILNMNYF
tara:strand:- start:952 stop:1515 length:564 start_codon:yes stop_codon:yes gene_type:complete